MIYFSDKHGLASTKSTQAFIDKLESVEIEYDFLKSSIRRYNLPLPKSLYPEEVDVTNTVLDAFKRDGWTSKVSMNELIEFIKNSNMDRCHVDPGTCLENNKSDDFNDKTDNKCDSDYAFYLAGAVWVIRFKGKRVLLPESKSIGLMYLHFILEKNNSYVSYNDLNIAFNISAPDVVECHQDIDFRLSEAFGFKEAVNFQGIISDNKSTESMILHLIDEENNKLEIAKEQHDIVRIEECTEKIDKYKELLKALSRVDVDSAKRYYKNLKDKVDNAIKRAKEVIRSNGLPELGNHFDIFLKYDSNHKSWTYTQTERIPWKLYK